MFSPDSTPNWATAFTPELPHLLTRLESLGVNPTIVIDGPSGSGKSTVADFLVAQWPQGTPVQLVRLDDIYPGWEGLEAAATVVDEILLTRSQGRVAIWQKFDWHRGALTSWHEIDPGTPLIIEGCGALGLQARTHADLSVWVHADTAVRRERALARKGENFEEHWDSWDRQFDAFTTRMDPLRFANIILAAN